jgi:hypothetical protein
VGGGGKKHQPRRKEDGEDGEEEGVAGLGRAGGGPVQHLTIP